MTRVYEIALYPMAVYSDGSSGVYDPSDSYLEKVDGPEHFDVYVNLYIDDCVNDPVVEFDELTWEEAQHAIALLQKQYPNAGFNDLSEQCRGIGNRQIPRAMRYSHS